MEYVRGIAAALRHPHRLDAAPRRDPKYPTMAAGKYKLSFRLGTLPTLKPGAEWDEDERSRRTHNLAVIEVHDFLG
jgi:hypothetical protein